MVNESNVNNSASLSKLTDKPPEKTNDTKECKNEEFFIKKQTIVNLADKLYGGVWGVIDGFSSGAIIGAVAFNSGGWFFSSISQFLGSATIATGGAISGGLIGLLHGKSEIKDLCKNYRETFVSDLKVKMT